MSQILQCCDGEQLSFSFRDIGHLVCFSIKLADGRRFAVSASLEEVVSWLETGLLECAGHSANHFRYCGMSS